MQAIVLAGGLGTRLRKIIQEVPKPMAIINEKPFLEYILSFLHKQGVRSVIISVSYQYEVIRKYFGDSFLDMKILYSIEKELLGTGGAIKESLKFANESLVYVVNGDTYFGINLKTLELEKGSKICLGLKKMKDFDRYGCVEVDKQGFISAFREKEFRKEGLINGGIYLVDKRLFCGFSLQEKFSFEAFLQSHFIELKASGKVFEDYFIDIGIPQDYLRAQEEMRNDKE